MTNDTDGTLWVGTSRGLARLRAGRVTIFTTRNGLRRVRRYVDVERTGLRVAQLSTRLVMPA